MVSLAKINLYEAKTQLSALVERAAAGEEIIIAKNGKPMAKLVPIPAEKPRRVLETADWAKQLTQEQRDKLADQVMQPWPQDEIDLWYNSKLFPDDTDGPDGGDRGGNR